MAVLAVIFGSFIASLPRGLRVRVQNQLGRRIEYQRGQKEDTKYDESHGSYTRNLVNSLNNLIRNVPFMLMSFAMAFEGGFISAVASFGVKYTEEMFQLPATEAAILSGGVLIGAGVVGQLLGGYVIGKIDPKLKNQLLFIIVTFCSSAVW